MAFGSQQAQWINGAKIVLPLIALVLLSTLFLFSGRVDPSAAIPYAKIDVEALARDTAAITPEYSGMTEDGAVLNVKATRAQPDPKTGGALAQDVTAKLTAENGLVTDLRAKNGQFDPAGAGMILIGDVRVQTSTGYQLASDRIEMDAQRTRILSPGPVTAQAPFGTLEAGQMELRAKEGGKDHDLLFNARVKLVYLPAE